MADDNELMSAQDKIDFLGDDEESKLELEDMEEEPKKEAKPSKEEEKEEEEEKEPKEEDLDLSENISRKAILKEFPEIFKKFPGLERAFYREQAFTEVFPTVQDAKDAGERAKEFDKFESEVLAGNTESILESVKNADKDAFLRVADNFLPALSKIDSNVYGNVISNIMRTATVTMYQAGTSRNNENLKMAAQIFNEFVFGDGTIRAPQPLTQPKTDTGKSDLEQREEKFRQQQLDKSTEELTEKVQNTLTATIERYIDPNELMTSFVKKNAIKDVLAQVDSSIEEDSRFRATYNKLWERAAENGYDRASLDKIKKAYLSKAQLLLGPAIKTVRAEALKGVKKSEKQEKFIPEGKPASASRKPADSKTEIPKGMKTLDFLMKD